MSNIKKTQKDKFRELLDTPKVISWRLALNTVETLYSRFEEELTKSGCSMSRFEMLFLIHFDGPLSATQLSEKMRVSRGNISSFVKRLIKDDLITFSESSTSSRPHYILSREGELFFKRILKIHLKHIDMLVTPLSTKTLKELSSWSSEVSSL